MKVVPLEWISRPDENADGLLKVEFAEMEFGVPAAVETHKVSEEEVTLDKEQEFEMILESAGGMKVYRDLSDYEERSGSSMAAESIIPCGLFPAGGKEDPDFEVTARAILQGTVSKVYEDPKAFGFSEDEFLYSMKCLGCEFDVVARKSEITEKVVPGCIVSDVYWLQGWPAEQ